MQNFLKMINGWVAFLRRGGDEPAEESKFDKVLKALESMRETSKIARRTAMRANLPWHPIQRP